MKKILFIVSLFLLACDATTPLDEAPKLTTYGCRLTVTGDCPFISVDDKIYHGLYSSNDYLKDYNISVIENDVYKIIHRIEKHTNDTTTITATLEIDGAEVDTQTTSNQYGFISVSYTLR